MIDKIISSGNDLEEVTDLVPKNAVSLMTIHKSKGLEFKYVFVLQMNRKFIGHSKDGLSGKYIINREKGLGIKYLADLKDQINTNLPMLFLKP
jgi:ATP-dependent helicase/nuclease subunit A